MKPTSSFVIEIRNCALAIGLGILIPLIVMHVNEIILPMPDYSTMIKANYETHPKEWTEQNNAYKTVCKPAHRVRFFTSIFSGVICLLIAMFIHNIIMAAGFTISGVLEILLSFYFLSEQEPLSIKLLFLTLVLTLFLGCIYKVSNKK